MKVTRRFDPSRQDERALAHGEFIADGLDEISAQQLPPFNLQRIRFAIGFEAFGGCEFRERAKVVFAFLRPG